MHRKIINHWTAGRYVPNKDELNHYHFMVDNDNTSDGVYAAHTGGGNTKRIGIALCGMMGFVCEKKQGMFPITKFQIDTMCKLNAEILIQEGWEQATEDNLLTHYEFGLKNPQTSSAGKIDINFLPAYSNFKANEVGDFIRKKVNEEITKIRKKQNGK
jgi:hypothetical protein